MEQLDYGHDKIDLFSMFLICSTEEGCKRLVCLNSSLDNHCSVGVES